MTRLQRSIDILKADGWLAEKVEQWNSFRKFRKDLFGFIDIIAIKGNRVMAVQVTCGKGDVAAHVKKIRGLQSHELWLASPNREIAIHSWEKRGARGKRKTWTCMVTEVGVFEEVGPLDYHETEAREEWR